MTALPQSYSPWRNWATVGQDKSHITDLKGHSFQQSLCQLCRQKLPHARLSTAWWTMPFQNCSQMFHLADFLENLGSAWRGALHREIPMQAGCGLSGASRHGAVPQLKTSCGLSTDADFLLGRQRKQRRAQSSHLKTDMCGQTTQDDRLHGCRSKCLGNPLQDTPVWAQWRYLYVWRVRRCRASACSLSPMLLRLSSFIDLCKTKGKNTSSGPGTSSAGFGGAAMACHSVGCVLVKNHGTGQFWYL